MPRLELNVTRRLEPKFSDPALQKTVAAAFAAAHYRKNAVVEIFFVGDAEIKKLNRKFRNKNKPTDVLSFPLLGAKAWPGEGEELGDIVISVPTARKDAKKYGWKYPDEIKLLLVHGVLHLLGFDHLKEKERQRMFRAQNKALKTLGVGSELLIDGR